MLQVGVSEIVRIDLHGHSAFSDGLRSPDQIAELCAQRAVRFAALTDHNSIDGQDAFETACERLGIGFVSGVELHVLLGYRDLHLLCYGFDRTDEGFLRVLAALKTSRGTAGSAYDGLHRPAPPAVITAVHQAGGVVLMAHPLATEPDRLRLVALLDELFAAGLDGLEVFHPQTTEEDRAFLLDLASSRACLFSAGTDHHGNPAAPEPPLGVDLDAASWHRFRDGLVRRRRERPHTDAAARRAGDARDCGGGAARRMLMPMVLPALAVIVLFMLALFGFFLPSFEDALLERKRETIRELTRTIWSMLDEAEKQVRAGRIAPAPAREQAAERVRALRYGRERLDYFWIQDLSPRMIMHPYRTDLEGQDLSGFRDPLGSPIFNLFVENVRRDGAGYVDYVWQWMDDPDRMEAKESYVKLFEPWGWVIGTGLYINDVKAEIRALEVRLYHVMLAIGAALMLLLLFMLRGGLKSERLRLLAEQRLHESNARYASLVKAASEGVLFVRKHRCVYANPVFLELAGCDADELALLDWQELFPEIASRPPTADAVPEAVPAAVYRTAGLRRRDGTSLACRVTIKGVSEGGGGSYVVLVRRADEPVQAAVQASDGSLLKRLLNLPATAAEDIAQRIAASQSPEAVIECCRRAPELVRAMLDSSAAPTAIAAMLSTITDAATSKFIELTQRTLGPPPAPFAFVVVGSQGRREQTLYTDQDNILIHAGTEEAAEAQAYFSALAGRVCALLAQAGYRECKGQLMASKPAWRHSLDTWFGMFSRWIGKAEGHEAMDFMTLFDMRCVHGDAGLVAALRDHIDREIGTSPWFFTQAARNAIQFKTPLRIFGTIVTAGRATEKSGHLDLKAAMMPIVCYARLYALKRQLHSTGTLDRLSALCDLGVLLPSRHHDILTAFETLMRLRLRHQSEMKLAGGEPDNLIRLANLGHIDEAVLKECFIDIDRIQEGIGREVLGGEAGNQ